MLWYFQIGYNSSAIGKYNVQTQNISAPIVAYFISQEV
jgi:hypothetical protein